MKTIEPPASSRSDRIIACQEALETSFRELMDHAVKAGWTEGEAMAALIELAENHMLANQERENEETILEMILRMT